MTSSIQFLLSNAPGIDRQTLFQTFVFFNRLDDVEFLLKNHPDEIDIQENNNFALKHISAHQNLPMLKVVLMNGRSKTQVYINGLLRYSKFIPFLIGTFYKRKMEKGLAEQLINVAIQGNNKSTFEYLIENDIQDFVSDYKYVIVASGADRIDILSQFQEVVKEVGDECIETAYLSGNMKTVQFLLKDLKIPIVNKFLEQAIREKCSREHPLWKGIF